MPATQIERPFRIKTPLGEDALLLDRFEGIESISRPFRFTVRMLSPDPNIDLESLLTKPAVVAFNLDDETERYVHGHLNRVRLLRHGEHGMAAYEAEIVPWLWFLNNFSDCRIFQGKTVPEIIEQVFHDRGFRDYRFRLQGQFPRRDYCVQYRETDLNFVSRLMEEEGIFYFFEHTPEQHLLILANHNSAFRPCPNQSRAQYLTASGGLRNEDTVFSLETQYQAQVGKVSLTDYDFEKPKTSLLSSLSNSLKGEDYDYPGKYVNRDDGDRYARIRLEEREARLVTVGGESNCDGFECGYTFELSEFHRDDANRQYIITVLEHSAKNTGYRAGEPEPYSYSNHVEAIPASVPFRPMRLTARPVVQGCQTAVVVGPRGEEIYTDKYGRVKVRFHWDREANGDGNSSCWIRVAHSWAGKGWGSISIPRVGQEVIVDFLEGDPDRPIIVGSVYNADQTTPYKLPDEQTKSTLKTMSSKGGGGFNEIRLEDKKGSEQVFVHAEKDLDVRVKNDRREWTGHDRHLIVARDKAEQVQRDSHLNVKRDQIQKIGRDQHLEVSGKSAVKITGSSSLSVSGDVIEEFKANHTSKVTQDLYLKAMQIVIEAGMGITLKVGSNFITIDASGIAIQGMPVVQINSAGAALAGSPGSLIAPLAPTDPAEADNANPGAVTSVGAPQQTPPSVIVLESITATKRSAASDTPPHDPDSEENQRKTHWIEIELIDEDGNPFPGEAYRITLPDGATVADGTLDSKGRARVEGIDAGVCKVTFPNLDKDMWRPA